MQIATIGANKFRATFNRRSLLITNDSAVAATDTATDEAIEGAELKSIESLVKWHLKSKLDSNELPTLWTVRP
jgi:hypothetical protein